MRWEQKADHICPVFDVGSQNGIDFLVMEYLEGETLAQRLTKGAPPLRVTQRSEGLGFALEPLFQLGVRRDVFGEDLNGDGAIEAGAGLEGHELP
jgi:hypothetical protein